MTFAQLFRHDQRRKFLTDGVLPSDPEGRGSSWIEFENATTRVDGDYTIEGCTDHRRTQHLALNHSLQCAPAIDELTNLRSGGGHQCEHRRLSSSRFRGEELHDSKDIRPGNNRKGEPSVKPGSCGKSRAWKIPIDDDVIN